MQAWPEDFQRGKNQTALTKILGYAFRKTGK